MMLTEELAKKKWCPFARSYDTTGDYGAGVTINRGTGGKPDNFCLCIASACMAWRPTWERGDAPVGMRPSDDPSWIPDGLPIGRGGAVTHRQNFKRPVGFCGLACKPQEPAG